MLDDLVDALACPHCGSGFALVGRSLRCAHGHTFDIARQGYVSLLPGESGDTATMVAARADFLAAGHFDPVSELVAGDVARFGAPPGHIVDVGAGTGHYLARVLDHLPDHTGIALDASKYACRRAAKAHPRAGAVVSDVWRVLPVRTAAASVVMNVFAPRNPAEMHRVLRPGCPLVVVTPNASHLGELVSALGLLHVDERKQDRLGDQLGGWFTPLRQTSRELTMSLRHKEIEAVVSMGPSARHMTPEELAGRIARLPDPLEVTASVSVSVYERTDW